MLVNDVIIMQYYFYIYRRHGCSMITSGKRGDGCAVD